MIKQIKAKDGTVLHVLISTVFRTPYAPLMRVRIPSLDNSFIYLRILYS